MEHYVAYHSTKVMGRDYAPGQEFSYRSKKAESFLRGAIGAWAWVIVGEKTAGGTAFRLVGVYAVAEVREDDEGFVVSGPGHPFDPPLPLNAEPWFPELLQEQANFSLGFNRIRGDVVVAVLEAQLAAAGSASLGVSPSVVATFSSRGDPKAHATFQAWREANPDGFLLNCQTATRGLLHRVDCSHLGDTSWDGADLTRLRKACAAGLSILRRWGEAEGIREIRTCPDCDPVDDVQTAAHYADSMLADGSFSPDDAGDARRRVLASIVQRQGQPQFRRSLLDAYGNRCAITGCTEESVLEAAHIRPYRGPWTNHPQNGLLLRTDLHTLFDLGLISVATETMTLVVSPKLLDVTYTALAGRAVSLPARADARPNREALTQHRARCDF
jgi:hypothetical protein